MTTTGQPLYVRIETLTGHEWPYRATLYSDPQRTRDFRRIRGAFGHTPQEAYANLSVEHLEIAQTWLDWSQCEIKA